MIFNNIFNLLKRVQSINNLHLLFISEKSKFTLVENWGVLKDNCQE